MFFETQEKNQVTVIKCPRDLSARAVDEFSQLVSRWLQRPGKVYIFDFQDVVNLNALFFKPITLFNQALKKNEGYLFAVHMNKDIQRQIQLAGIDSVLVAKADIRAAMEAAGIKIQRPQIDVNFVNPFIAATIRTLETQAGTKVGAGKIRLKKEGEPFDIDIAGVISLTSNAFNGSIALCFPSRVFLSIYSKMVGEEVKEITKDIEDAAGEILNIVFGQAKAELNDRQGYHIEKAIPTVVRGGQLKVHHLSRSIAVVLPFETEFGGFHIEVSVDFL